MNASALPSPGIGRTSGRSSACLSILGLSLLLSVPTRAQENQELGRMWTFENPPLAYLEKEYGFKPDQKWLNSLRLAALRLGGETVTRGFCSASFVSPKGLIMTNNHCVRDAVSSTSQDGPGRVKSGFYAASYEDEYRLKTDNDGWLTVSQLNRITTITDRVNAGIAEGDDEATIKSKREANKKKILEEAKQKDPKLVPQVVSLYQGGIFQLYQYRVFNDVRLVCMPHLQTAHFGGDPDNFTYPRYSIDFSFLRAYEDGKPADTTEHYFKWKQGGAAENELVFVPGNPGSTERLNTKAQMDYQRDVKLPILLEMLTNRLNIFRKLIKQRPPLADHFRTQMLSWENGEKAFTGNIRGLKDPALMAQKVAAEKAFKARVMKDPKLAEKYGKLWEQIAEVAAKRRVQEPLSHFHAPGNSYVLNSALTIVRAFDPEESAEDRAEAQKELKTLRVGQENLISIPIFTDHVTRAHKWLSDNDPFFTKVMGGKGPTQFLRSMLRSRVLLDDERAALTEGGWEAIAKSEDVAIVAARELAKLIRADSKVSKDLDAKEDVYGARIAQALFATYGTGVSPDATMTLRFTDGRVKGYPCNGTLAPFRTSFYGLYARNAEFDNKHPFDLPEAWLERQDKIDMTKSVNFVSTNDITGGNSGSVVVNKELRVVGLIFDGNIESLHNDFVFKQDVPRSVSVHVDGIIEAMAKIYQADRVVKELIGE
ncbi:MAG: S46 family peptidase [Planctomycetes bacterium]|nr:S46 family peptidase [Planctomycetota bacterium]